MKKMIMALAMVLTVSTSFAFTGERAVNNRAIAAFKTEFAGATNAAWTVVSDYYKVDFTMGNQQLVAFYNAAGDFVAVTRYISSFNLPLFLQKSLKKSHGNYWITDLFEMANQEGTSYYVTVESADTKIVLKSVDGGAWLVYQKIQKA